MVGTPSQVLEVQEIEKPNELTWSTTTIGERQGLDSELVAAIRRSPEVHTLHRPAAGHLSEWQANAIISVQIGIGPLRYFLAKVRDF